jgi:hypothetical protein
LKAENARDCGAQLLEQLPPQAPARLPAELLAEWLAEWLDSRPIELINCRGGSAARAQTHR